MCLIYTASQAQISREHHAMAPLLQQKTTCLSEEDRQEIWEVLKEKRATLRKQTSTQEIQLQWPVKQGVNFDEWEPIGISNYVDLESNYPDQLLDYNCGTRTYDTQNGYNHKGTDIFSWPFAWRKMDHNQLEIIAAAPGTIIYKQEEHSDKSCTFNSNPWNAVYVEHADGSIAWYGHLKKGSLTSKEVGHEVVVGEFLGVMGSSGNSTGPHLHFELYDAAGNLIDPFLGNCNPTTNQSWWENQPDYLQSRISNLMTHYAPPQFGCYEDESPNMSVNFAVQNTIYFATYFRDQLEGVASYHRLLMPDGSEYVNWESLPNQFYAASYWWRSFTIPSVEGKWTFEVEYLGTTRQQYFYVYDGNPKTNITLSVDSILFENIPAGTEATATFDITNAGTLGVLVDAISFPEGFSGGWDGRIYDGETKTITVTFSPEYDDVFLGNLEILTTSEGPRTIVLLGKTGVEISRILTMDASLDFGEVPVDEVSTQQVTLGNEGNAVLKLTEISYPEGFSGPTALNIDPDGSALLEITFAPVIAGTHSGTLTFQSNATGGSTDMVLQGIGTEVLSVGNTTGYIYPNPNSTGILYLSGPVLSVEIFDLSGKLMLQSATTQALDIRSLQRGIYLITTRTAQSVRQERLWVR